MKPELRERIIAYNKKLAEQKEKTNDLDIIVGEIIKLPPGQLKKILTADVISVLAKHGYSLD